MAALLCSPAAFGAQDEGKKPKKIEKQKDESFYAKFAEKMTQPGETVRDRWLKDLNKAFPNRVSAGQTDSDLAQWFSLLSNGTNEWHRQNAHAKSLTELHDRVSEDLNLKRGEPIRWEQFASYTQANLRPGSAMRWKTDENDPGQAADKLFQKYDRNRDGTLSTEELPGIFRISAVDMDLNKDGRIEASEFRSYFQMRVQSSLNNLNVPAATTIAAPAIEIRAAEPVVREMVFRAGKLPPGLPAWFAPNDLDHDGQLGLYEWRKASLPVSTFQTMDLNGDGFLTAEEVLRYLRQAKGDAVNVPLPQADTRRK